MLNWQCMVVFDSLINSLYVYSCNLVKTCQYKEIIPLWFIWIIISCNSLVNSFSWILKVFRNILDIQYVNTEWLTMLICVWTATVTWFPESWIKINTYIKLGTPDCALTCSSHPHWNKKPLRLQLKCILCEYIHVKEYNILLIL